MKARARRLARRWAPWLLRFAHRERALVAPEFDRAYYLGAYPDVAKSGLDPLDHFLAYGWREGRDPSPRFSVQDYLETNPDVAAAGVNPFVHFLRNGRKEGRSTPDELGFRHRVIGHLRSIEAQVATAQKAAAAAPAGAAGGLEAGLARSRTGLRDLHITFSHDDYRLHVGGLQLCVQQEAAELAALGRDHLHLFPATSWPVVRTSAEPGRLEVVLNGDSLGAYAAAEVAATLAQAGRGGQRSFAIHSLLGHAAEETAAILEAAGLKAGFFWLHDYASVCAGYNLLRNDVEDCGAPPPDSAACGICIYGPARRRHLDAHEALFRRLALTVVSPARPTLETWRKGWSYPAADTVVHPHVRLTPRGPAPLPAEPEPRPLRIAYAGYPVAHKGWPVFRDLVFAHADDPRYAFLHFGVRAEAGLPVTFHQARITPAQPQAMREALEAHEIDVVLFWPLWRETFSFAVHEAIAAGCAVITGPDGGNVAAVVAEGDHGCVLPDEAALAEAFASGRVASLGRAARRPMLYDLTLSGMTIDLIRARAAA